MQSGAVDVGAPVAAVEGGIVAVANRRGDRALRLPGEEDDHAPAERGAGAREEVGREGRMVAVAQEGIAVVAVDVAPERGIDVVTVACLDLQPGLGAGAPLFPRRTAPPLRLNSVTQFGADFAELRYDVIYA